MVGSGHITVDVELADAADDNGVAAQKVVSLKRRNEYASGKVAIVSGTCSQIRVSINPASLTYTDAAGNPVAFSGVRRLVLQAEPGAFLYRSFFGFPYGCSMGEPCVVSDFTPDTLPVGGYSIASTSVTSTASFTLVIYGT